jgi:hypothetical protein
MDPQGLMVGSGLGVGSIKNEKMYLWMLATLAVIVTFICVGPVSGHS